MAKQSGIGDNLYVAGYDLTSDVGSIQSIRAPSGVLVVTGLDKSGIERIHGLRDGGIDFTHYFNDAALAAHAALAAKGSGADRVVSWFRGTAIGNKSASLVSKQIEYGFTRGQDGSLQGPSQFLANGFGLEYGEQLTAGKRTDTGATNGASLDFGAVSTLFGLSAYLHVFSFTGTDVTIKLQDSANDSTFADITGGGFTQVTGGAPLAQRIVTGLTATVRRYVRVATVTTGGFSNLVFAVCFTRYAGAGEQ